MTLRQLNTDIYSRVLGTRLSLEWNAKPLHPLESIALYSHSRGTSCSSLPGAKPAVQMDYAMTSDLPELLFVVNRHAEEQHCYQEARNNTELKTRPMVWFFNAT